MLAEADHGEVLVPECLQALPLCIRNGCDELSVLAWFRFGLRQRVCAHAFRSIPTPQHNFQPMLPVQKQFENSGENGYVRNQTVQKDLLDYARVVVRDGTTERTRWQLRV